MPIHPISPWGQRFQTDTHRTTADLGFAGIDSRTLAVGHLHRAEGRFETLGEGQRDPARRPA